MLPVCRLPKDLTLVWDEAAVDLDKHHKLHLQTLGHNKELTLLFKVTEVRMRDLLSLKVESHKV